jgi:hypothetical protein
VIHHRGGIPHIYVDVEVIHRRGGIPHIYVEVEVMVYHLYLYIYMWDTTSTMYHLYIYMWDTTSTSTYIHIYVEVEVIHQRWYPTYICRGRGDTP